MKLILSFFLLYLSLKAYVDSESWKNNIKPRLLSFYKGLEDPRIKAIKSILSLDILDDYHFSKEIGHGTFGFVFAARDRDYAKWAFKISFEDDENLEVCNDAYNAYKILADKGVQYIINMKKPIDVSIKPQTGGYFACGTLMERGTDLKAPILTVDDYGKPETERKFFDFMHKLLDGYYQINFKANSYHGDQKPANILSVESAHGILEPRIIDFDLMFEKKYEGFHPGFMLYTLDYRPPELRSIVPQTNIKTQLEKQNYRSYKFNSEFKEDAFAVGVTFKQILATNSLYLDQKNPYIVDLKNIVAGLLAQKVSSRLSTKAAMKMMENSIIQNESMQYEEKKVEEPIPKIQEKTPFVMDNNNLFKKGIEMNLYQNKMGDINKKYEIKTPILSYQKPQIPESKQYDYMIRPQKFINLSQNQNKYIKPSQGYKDLMKLI